LPKRTIEGGKTGIILGVKVTVRIRFGSEVMHLVVGVRAIRAKASSWDQV